MGMSDAMYIPFLKQTFDHNLCTDTDINTEVHSKPVPAENEKDSRSACGSRPRTLCERHRRVYMHVHGSACLQ